MKDIPVDSKVGEEGKGGGAPGARTQIPVQPMEETTVEQVSTLRPVEDPTPEK